MMNVMPRWIYNRPPEKCQDSEIRFAQLLNECLPDSWIVRWGYWYEDDRAVLREGDFLILGPHGGLAVLEVKTSLGYQSASGQWDTSDGDNPVSQLQAQHQGVIRHLESQAVGRRLPYVAKALVLPTLEIAPQLPDYRGVPRKLILAANDVRHFQKAWERLFTAMRPVEAAQRDLFLAAYGEGLNPQSVKAFVSETDQMLLRQASANYRLLDMLSGNRQLVVEGGVGTGKSWYAIEQARRLAENTGVDRGQDVLMVAYNLALCERLRAAIEKLKLKRGSVTVQSSESLAAAILEGCGIAHEVPEEPSQTRLYFDETLPQLALEALTSEPVRLSHLIGRYDALVVDEAQDHDSSLDASGELAPQTASNAGWWSLYSAVLRHGWESPMALFGDPAQRPPFRSAERFDMEVVRNRLPRHAHVRLQQALRYTRPVHHFLKTLDGEGTHRLVAGLPSQGQLPDGPEVLLQAGTPEQIPAMVEEILTQWQSGGLCAPSKVLILYDRSRIDRTALAGIESLCDHPLKPFVEWIENPQSRSISHSSIHKAKGLDALAVILVGLRPFDQLTTPYDRFTYFMGASRARQLLACVHVNSA